MMPVALSLRSPFRRKALTSLLLQVLLLSMLLTVGSCDSGEIHNFLTCYREIKGCEECKKCTNSVNKEECACAKPKVGDVLCDDVCMKNEDHSYREKRNWRVLGITLFSVGIISIAAIFTSTLVYWRKTDTSEPKSKVSPHPKELAVIEAPPVLAIGTAVPEEGGSAWTMRESAVGSGGSGSTGTTGSGGTGTSATTDTSSVPTEEPEKDAEHIARRLMQSTSIH